MSRRKRDRRADAASGPPFNHPPDALTAGYEVAQTPTPDALLQALLVPGVNSYVRTYRIAHPSAPRDSCSAIVTRERGAWHASISHPSRYPTWLEISTIRYRVIPNAAWMVMLLPPLEEYVNTRIGVKTMQLVEIDRAAVKGDDADDDDADASADAPPP